MISIYHKKIICIYFPLLFKHRELYNILKNTTLGFEPNIILY